MFYYRVLFEILMLVLLYFCIQDARKKGWGAVWAMFAAVILGGVIGARFVIEGVAHQRVAQLTGLLVLVVGLRILWAWTSYIQT